jgi:hypothetical protein
VFLFELLDTYGALDTTTVLMAHTSYGAEPAQAVVARFAFLVDFAQTKGRPHDPVSLAVRGRSFGAVHAHHQKYNEQG